MVHLYQISTLRTLLLQSASTHLLENTESLLELRKSAPPDIISVLSSQDDPWSIKATAQIPVQILYDFSSSIGQISIQNILFDLLNADIDRAEKTLLNHPYIKSVDIRVTPFWANRLPGDMDKIYIKVNNL